jgi:hypothetical protein
MTDDFGKPCVKPERPKCTQTHQGKMEGGGAADAAVNFSTIPEGEVRKRGVRGGFSTRPVFIHTNTGQQFALILCFVGENRYSCRDVVKQKSSVIRYLVILLDRLLFKNFMEINYLSLVLKHFLQLLNSAHTT